MTALGRTLYSTQIVRSHAQDEVWKTQLFSLSLPSAPQLVHAPFICNAPLFRVVGAHQGSVAPWQRRRRARALRNRRACEPRLEHRDFDVAKRAGPNVRPACLSCYRHHRDDDCTNRRPQDDLEMTRQAYERTVHCGPYLTSLAFIRNPKQCGSPWATIWVSGSRSKDRVPTSQPNGSRQLALRAIDVRRNASRLILRQQLRRCSAL